MSRTTKQINEMIEDTLSEYFSLTGPSLPTGTGAVLRDWTLFAVC